MAQRRQYGLPGPAAEPPIFSNPHRKDCVQRVIAFSKPKTSWNKTFVIAANPSPTRTHPYIIPKLPDTVGLAGLDWACPIDSDR